jgi:hypothetical protein
MSPLSFDIQQLTFEIPCSEFDIPFWFLLVRVTDRRKFYQGT